MCEFLERQGWRSHFEAVACRTLDTIDWMKPKPHLLQLAAAVMAVDPSKGVFIGDAVSDVIAGKAAGLPIVGLAKNLKRYGELHDAGADAVVNIEDRHALLPS